MTNKYCSWSTGSDDTGDGSASNPYKTIQKASTGLTGGDEVRCAKSAAPTALSGTMTWTNGSAIVNTTVDLRGVLSRFDYVRKTTLASGDYNIWWMVYNVTATYIELGTVVFRGTTGSGVSSSKLGVHNLGAVANQQDIVQYVNASGTSESSRLKITGGWNLSNETIDGETWYWQSGTNLYGYLLSIDDKGFLEIDGINLLRGYCAIRPYNILSWKPSVFKNAQTWGQMCLYTYSSGGGFTLDNCAFLNPLYVHPNSTGTTITNSTFYMNAGTWAGINCYTYNCTFLGTSSYSHTLKGTNNTFVDCNFGSTTIYYEPYGHNIVIYNSLHGTPAIANAQYYARDVPENFAPTLRVVKYNRTDNDHRAYYINGVVKSNTAQARSGTCAEFVPSQLSYYMDHFLAWVNVREDVPRTVSYYIKKTADFNGVVYAALFFDGDYIVDWTEVSLTTSYEQKTLTATSDMITENGAVGLKIRVRGSIGSVYVDDIDYT